MYDHLHGEVVEKQTSRAVIRCGGVGYEVRISLTSAAGLKVGQTCQVFTILHVVDGTPSLLGFASRSERELARKLLGVGGVGPSIALSLLSVLPPADLARAVARGDTAALKAVKGVGQKTAEQILLDLRGKAAMLSGGGSAQAPAARGPAQLEDAVTALISIGYSEKDARKQVERASKTVDPANLELLVRTALQG